MEEFDIDLSEIHNDSTTVTFSGQYAGAGAETTVKGRTVPAITWGHNKDHRPDLKQLLYNLTVSSDGEVPIVFGVENGNVTDDKTHQRNWDRPGNIWSGFCVATGSMSGRPRPARTASCGR